MKGTALNKYIFYSYLDSVVYNLHQKHHLKALIRETDFVFTMFWEYISKKKKSLIQVHGSALSPKFPEDL